MDDTNVPEKRDFLAGLEKYVETGSSEDFYAIQDIISSGTGLKLVPLSDITIAFKEQVAVKNSTAKDSTESMFGTENYYQFSSIVFAILFDYWYTDDDNEDAHLDKIATIFSKELEELRNDSSFTGSATQMAYLRDVLLCDSRSHTIKK